MPPILEICFRQNCRELNFLIPWTSKFLSICKDLVEMLYFFWLMVSVWQVRLLDNIDYNRLNMDNVERIEIVKGAASSLYGSNAVGGVVNIISKVSAEPWTVNLNGRYGAYNEQRYGGTIGFNAGKFNSVTNVQHTQVDEKDLADGKTNEETEDWAFKKVYGDKTWNFKESFGSILLMII